MNKLGVFLNLPIYSHLLIGALIRLVLIIYADYHDKEYEVPYTDIDYKVYSDAAQYVNKYESPYRRNTYRYSPLIAYMMLPSLYFGKDFGKIIFCIFDLLITMSLKLLVEHQLRADKPNASQIATFCSLFWLYNPMSIGISTRGNADSISCFFIIVSLLFLQNDRSSVKGLPRYICAGFFLGLAIHLRLYPMVFSFSMFISLGEHKINRSTRFVDLLPSVIPNRKQIALAVSCFTTAGLITFSMYSMYGYEFIFETYLYHLFRKDTRHNFSVLFYHSYLSMDLKDWVKSLTQAFGLFILFSSSLTFGTEPETLPFALFIQAVVLVTYNSVLTSQYFTWFLSLLPIVIHNFKMKPVEAVRMAIMWIAAQATWLFFAYLLEFQSKEVFIFIWLNGLFFFCANVYILGQLISCYQIGYGFGPINSNLREDTLGF